MSNKLLYGLLGVLGVGAIGTVLYNNSLDDTTSEVETEEHNDKATEANEADEADEANEAAEERDQEGGDRISSIEEDTFSAPDIDLSEIFQIQFEDPDHLISKKEKKSKLLKRTSSLYSVLSVYRSKLLSAYGEDVSDQRMDFHIELVKRSEEWTEEKLLDRVKELEGRCIDLADTDVWNIGRHSVTIKTGRVMGYGNTHITLAYFKEGVPEDVEDVLFEMDDGTTEMDDTYDDGTTEVDETNDELDKDAFLTL